jgi:hypothetical protein
MTDTDDVQQVRKAMAAMAAKLERASALNSSVSFTGFDIEKAVRSQMFFLEHGRLPVGDEIT